MERSAIEETVAMLEATLESTRDAILVVDLNRRIIRYNRRYLTIFGLTRDLVESGGVDAIVAALRDQLEDFDDVMTRSREIWRDPSREMLDKLKFKDGRVFERFVAPHRVGSEIVGVVASFRDVSQTARTEQALAQYRAFLEKAQEVAHIGSWVAELGGPNRIGWSNETYQHLRRAARVVRRHHGRIPRPRASRRSRRRESGARSGRRAAPTRLKSNIGSSAPTAPFDGSRRAPTSSATPAGRPVRMIGTVQDSTDRRQLEEQLRQSQKLEAIGRLAGGVAHDLNNALTAIGGYAELALGELTADQSARLDVEEIRRAAERAASVTRQLLAFSRKQLLEPRVFDVNETISSLGRMLERLHRRRRRAADTRGRRRAADRRGPGAVRAGDHQPGGERARRDAVGRPTDDRHDGRRARRDVRTRASADAARHATSSSASRTTARA